MKNGMNRSRNRTWRRSAILVSLSALIVSCVGVATDSGAASTPRDCTVGSSCSTLAATIGTPDATEPSGMGLPSASALSGYTQTYSTDFPGSSLPPGWSTFAGQPGGDPGSWWQASQVVVSSGELQLNATYSSSKGEWLTGGTCDCSRAQTYGAYFVRSRMTGAGPTVVELLWPSHGWPPEIDFNETYGPSDTSMATVHYDSSNNTDHRTVAIDMTAWHTWGVVWTPTTITYVVDGTVWGVVNATNEIPTVPMTLDIQQQTWCSSGFACPTAPQSTLVDWATVYSPSSTPTVTTTVPTTTVPPTTSTTSTTSTTVAPVHAKTQAPRVRFRINADSSVERLSATVQQVALAILDRHAHTVTVVATNTAHYAALSAAKRVLQIKWMLDNDVRHLGANVLKFYVIWSRLMTPHRVAPKIVLTVSP